MKKSWVLILLLLIGAYFFFRKPKASVGMGNVAEGGFFPDLFGSLPFTGRTSNPDNPMPESPRAGPFGPGARSAGFGSTWGLEPDTYSGKTFFNRF